MITTDYEQQAIDFLTKTDTKLEIVKSSNQTCPDWKKCEPHRFTTQYWGGSPKMNCQHNHGVHYDITISRAGRKPYTFSYWGSINDRYSKEYEKYVKLNWQSRADEERALRTSSTPTAYDVLTCISGDIGMHDWTFEEFCGDFGYDTDSRQAEKTYNAVCDQSRALAHLFNDEELDQLREIQ